MNGRSGLSVGWMPILPLVRLSVPMPNTPSSPLSAARWMISPNASVTMAM